MDCPPAGSHPTEFAAPPRPTVPATGTAARVPGGPRRHGPLEIVFLSGEPDTPGHTYRVERYAATARDLGHRVHVGEARRAEQAVRACPAADLVVLWRAEWCHALEIACAGWRRNGGVIAFDVDDYMFDPGLARVELIDGIRSLDLGEAAAAALYGRMRRTLLEADVGFATTEPLAAGMRALGKTAFVLPNGFDARTWRTSRLAALARRIQPDDGLVRIGYAAGSCTHQHDFAVAASAVADVLRDNPHARLVLFRQGAFGRRLLDPAEFPAFDSLARQIEWRPMVPLHLLPEEIARFDVNLAPLEVGNAFCEAKSELKFFEAALVGVPTVASPTAPFARAIRDGETGILARSPAEWRSALDELVADAGLRQRLGRSAAIDVIAWFGPEPRAATFAGVLAAAVTAGHPAGRSCPADAAPAEPARRPLPEIPACELLHERQTGDVAEVAVLVCCRDDGRCVDAALDAVAAQTAASLELVVVDDGSTDDSAAVVAHWLARHSGRFAAATHLRTPPGSGPALVRNAGFAWATAPLVLPIDAGTRLEPGCVAALRDGAADPAALVRQRGDAASWPAVVRRSEWARCGGYRRAGDGTALADVTTAAEATTAGPPPRLPEQAAASATDAAAGAAPGPAALTPTASAAAAGPQTSPPAAPEDVGGAAAGGRGVAAPRAEQRPWDRRVATAAGDPAVPPPRPRDEQSLRHLLGILRCPVTGRPLEWRSSHEVVTDDGTRTWPVVGLRPLLHAGLARAEDRGEHVSHEICAEARQVIDEAEGLVLNLSAGGTRAWHPRVVEVEAAIFRNTDVVADVHALPFRDGVFSAVVALNAFEHFRNPFVAAAEIARVLAPGGRLLIHTAFMQPLHEAPWHYFNATKHGVLEWFPEFTPEAIRVSANFNPFFTVGWLAHELGVRVRAHLPRAEAALVMSRPLEEVARIWGSAERWEHPVYRALAKLPQEAQEGIAAGFEFVGRRR